MQRRPLLVVAMFLLLCVGAFSQQPTGDRGKDLFTGKWKLNVSKSSDAPKGETITIENQGGAYKITCDIYYKSGIELTLATTSDMNGTPSEVIQTHSKMMGNDEWRVTRQSSRRFIVESDPYHAVYQYTVSQDGTTLSAKELSAVFHELKIENGHPKQASPMLVFDRVR